MKICKIPQSEIKLMLATLDQIQIAPGLDNADMYVGLGLKLQQARDTAEEVDDNGRTDG
jgi:uncharacterized protein YqeY